MNQSSVTRRVWAVAWPPLSVLVLHSSLAVVFGHHRSLDPLFHFLGGVAGATSLWTCLDAFRLMARLFPPWDRRILSVLVMVGVVIGWELAEFGSDRLLGSHIQHGPLDTGSDIALGLIGAAAAMAVVGVVAARPSSEGSKV
jgi:hypothetical protein